LGEALVPGRHVTDHQMRLFMKHRSTVPVPVAAVRAGFSAATSYRIEHDPRPLSLRKAPRDRRRPDPLAEVFDAEVVPMLEAAPGLRPVAVLEEVARAAIPSWAQACVGRSSGASASGERCMGQSGR